MNWSCGTQQHTMGEGLGFGIITHLGPVVQSLLSANYSGLIP